MLGYILATWSTGWAGSGRVVLGILLISYVLPHVVGAAAFSWLFDANFGGVVNYLVIRRDRGRTIALVHRSVAEPDDGHR